MQRVHSWKRVRPGPRGFGVGPSLEKTGHPLALGAGDEGLWSRGASLTRRPLLFALFHDLTPGAQGHRSQPPGLGASHL